MKSFKATLIKTTRTDSHRNMSMTAFRDTRNLSHPRKVSTSKLRAPYGYASTYSIIKGIKFGS